MGSALNLLTTALGSSGRERAAHSLLDPAITQARNRDWAERDSQHPPRPIPAGHLRHQRDLDRAAARLGHARREMARLEDLVRDLQTEHDQLSRWSRSRRQQLSTAITSTTGTDLPYATSELHAAHNDVEVLTRFVDADTRQQQADEHTARERRHRTWLARSDTSYLDPNQVVAPADRDSHPAARGPRNGHAAHPNMVEPPGRAPAL
jgi:hypothetical protein